MAKETEQEKLLRHLRRKSLNEVRDHYFDTQWISFKDLKEYFKESGWTRGELVKADRPTGRGEARWEKRILYWYLHGMPDLQCPPTDEEIKLLEESVRTNNPCIVTTVHGYYESDVIYNPTWKQMLRCVRESIYVNKDPDHCGVNLPTVETFHDGGVDEDITYHVITFSNDS